MPFVFIPAEGPASEVDFDLEVYHNDTTTPELTDGGGDENCPFCQESEESLKLFNIGQPIADSELVIKPALGMLIPGYFLAVTKQHITSFARLEPEQLRQTDEALTRVEAYLGAFATFGEYFRFEHGSDKITECGTGACIDHAHLHLIPDPETADVIREALPWQKLATYEDLSELKGKPYVYLGRRGEHLVVEEPSLPSQWVRRQLAQVRGLENWDWATYHGFSELLLTFIALGQSPRGRIVWNLSKDRADY